MIAIPCTMCRTTHALSEDRAAVVIVVLLGMLQDEHLSFDAADRNADLCVKEALRMGFDQEGYAEHVDSMLDVAVIERAMNA